MKPSCSRCNDTGQIGYSYCNVMHATPCDCGAAPANKDCPFCLGKDGSHGPKCRTTVVGMFDDTGRAFR